MWQNASHMKLLRLPLIILFALIAVAVSAEIKTPVIEDDFTDDTIVDPHDGRRRSRPMMQWVTIDTDALTVTTTLTDPVITYYIMDESGEVMLIAADAPEQFAADVATLPAGDYTIRLLTATDRSFSGPLTIN